MGASGAEVSAASGKAENSEMKLVFQTYQQKSKYRYPYWHLVYWTGQGEFSPHEALDRVLRYAGLQQWWYQFIGYKGPLNKK